jgi:hypothetical protein
LRILQGKTARQWQGSEKKLKKAASSTRRPGTTTQGRGERRGK